MLEERMSIGGVAISVLAFTSVAIMWWCLYDVALHSLCAIRFIWLRLIVP